MKPTSSLRHYPNFNINIRCYLSEGKWNFVQNCFHINTIKKQAQLLPRKWMNRHTCRHTECLLPFSVCHNYVIVCWPRPNTFLVCLMRFHLPYEKGQLGHNDLVKACCHINGQDGYNTWHGYGYRQRRRSQVKSGDKYWEERRGGVWGRAVPSQLGVWGLAPRKEKSILC